jgi:hypothetical protein
MKKTCKPTVYIASPYSKGDPAANAHFQCKIFDQLLSSGLVLPVAPIWSHFQHSVFPRAYKDWIEYDQEMLPLYDCCLRLDASLPDINYEEKESKGADAEVETFRKMDRPVFFSIESLYEWAKEQNGS